ncbi:anaerobic ribonucleoside-triphosphate reductase, partial [Bacteroides congonensis]|uniref:anaerobic ribonucleoside-triphosphate reductase n=1 Tax=Bacteroides congonensis TaxID=1871006 RepID=UPI003219C19E
DYVERALMQFGYYDIAKTFILYREQRKSTRFVKERIDYMNQYSQSADNAASSSETDGNANVTMKNVANLEGEVYKTTNRIIQRQRMKDELNILFPEVAKQYETDLDNHIVYTHDEASTPVLKQYCMAVSLYPLLTEGVGNIDGVTPSEPNDLQSFSGQITNLIFLLSSQCKGAVAVGEYFIALNYYVVKEFGDKWYEKLDCEASSPHCLIKRTVRDNILKAFKQFVWGVNQPAGNRSYQSPFTNISYYDHTYFTSLFGEFCYPDGSKPEWIAIDTLQRMFMKWFNQIRLKQVLTFPVETFAMVHNGDDIIDQNYKQFCAEMYAEGHSFFTYISDSADSLASCCRLRNELAENTFSPTSGLTGVMTGSCNVITLNINRIVQDWALTHTLNGAPLIKGKKLENIGNPLHVAMIENDLKNYLIGILKRVYKYHIAFKTMLYDLEDKGMFAASNGGYIHISKLYSTIGINGLNEAARFLGMKVSNNPEYIEFLQLILGTIKEQNKLHSIHDRKRPFLFNSEVVPAEGLGGKNYKWDKEDGYVVPEDENLYNSYFYNAHDNTSVLDKFVLHGHQTYQYTDGGSAAHINLEDHLSKEQYLKLIDFAIANGTNYFTFNIPNSKCEDCGKIIKRPIDICPCCGSHNITQYTRVIGYLRPTKAFGSDRQTEALNRKYSDGKLQI